jgi:hypothetical protein
LVHITLTAPEPTFGGFSFPLGENP